jgi:hypothetical protein
MASGYGVMKACMHFSKNCKSLRVVGERNKWCLEKDLEVDGYIISKCMECYGNSLQMQSLIQR